MNMTTKTLVAAAIAAATLLTATPAEASAPDERLTRHEAAKIKPGTTTLAEASELADSDVVRATVFTEPRKFLGREYSAAQVREFETGAGWTYKASFRYYQDAGWVVYRWRTTTGG